MRRMTAAARSHASEADEMSRRTVHALVLLTALLLACELPDDGTGPDVEDPVATTLVIEPATATLDAIGATVQLSARVSDQNGDPMNGAVVAWRSLDADVATVDSLGKVTAVAPGATGVVASSGEVADTARIEVRLEGMSLEIVPDSLVFAAIGDSTRLTAVLRDRAGEAVDSAVVVWTSGDTTVATVDAEGLVIARGNGETEISAATPYVVGTVPVRVGQMIASLVVSPAPAAVGEGDTLRLGAEFVDANGVSMGSAAGKVTWTIVDPDVATIDSDGLVTGGPRGGETLVIATYAELSDTVPLRVMDQIAFRAGNQVFVVNDDGSGLRQVSSAPPALISTPEPPVWSPDGSLLAFMQLNVTYPDPEDSTIVDRDTDIHVVNADGTGEIVLTLRDGFDGYPTWSPKGDRIAFVSDRGEWGDSDLWVMSPDGSNANRIAENVLMEARPAWSPDGSWIAFYGTLAGGPGGIYRITPEGAGFQTLVAPVWHLARPEWSPDSEKILYSTNANLLAPAPEVDTDIWVVNRDGTNPRQLTNHPASDINPSWSPDGSRIVFQSNRDGQYAIFVMNADGTGQTRLTDPTMEAVEPTWSPDGRRIVFAGFSPVHGMNLFIVSVDGGEPIPLLGEGSIPGWLHVPVWRPRPRGW